MRHKTIAIAGLVALLILSTGEVAHAAVPTTLPAGCLLQPGRFEVQRIYGAHNAVRVTTAAVACVKWANVDAVTESILMSRYAPSTHTWIPERRVNFYVSPGGELAAPAIDMAVYCNVPGALMAMRVIDSFFFLDSPQAQVTYNGRTTAICAPLPAGCVVQPGRVQVLPIKGAHHAVRVTTVGVLCDQTSNVDSIRQTIVLLRYWVQTGKWTAERTVVVDSGPAAPAVDVAVYCNVPGALMAVRVVDTFYKTVTSSQMNFPGQTNVLCPR